MKLNNPFKLVIAIVVSQLAGLIGSVFTISSIPTWYAALQKPSFGPPNWIFGPAWTTLYLLMGVAAFLVWRYGLERKEVKTALAIFGGQLVLNTLWSIIFFGLHNPFWAFIEIIILWLAIIWMIFAFYRISRPAALLLLPYILWVSFAGYLNYSIWQLNPSTGLGQVACTQEAKLCPDGSYVGRTGPRCEFAPCPGEMEWQAIKQAIANCEVESVWQTHDRRVEAKLKNGEELAAVEPKLDDIIDLAIAAEEKCGEILMGTE